ncbi:MAG: transcriptional regulator GcvA [Alphaproteobacteria bacterium]|nr:MAG: transcriptional regulator GcvA [Alphaproteobacteria bacterium]
MSGRRLPPLTALRTFEVAARLMSVSRAAEELSVTPAAVRHQIRLLEDQLGTPLTHRDGRGFLLTDAGQLLLPGLRTAFDKLAEAVAAVDRVGESGPLDVSVAPSFAIKWLLPRLDRFQTKHPDIDVRLSASMGLTDFSRDPVDLAIRYGRGHYDGLMVEKLLPEAVYPVCSPELLANDPALSDPAALAHHTLLHDASPDDDQSCPTWPMWLAAAGITGVDAERGPRFNQSSLVLEAALLGKGIALAKATLAQADLDSGRLVRPFGDAVGLGFAYWIVVPESKVRLKRVKAFRTWLKAEAAAVFPHIGADI